MTRKSALLSLFISSAFAFSHYESLAGLSQRDIDQFILSYPDVVIPNPPGPLENDSIKLVNDPAHPFIPPTHDDIRGPCPGLNTLANHGVRNFEIIFHRSSPLTCFCQYLPRSGVARPDQIVSAVMEGIE